MKVSIPSAHELSRKMTRGVHSGLSAALPGVIQQARGPSPERSIVPYDGTPDGEGHLRDSGIVLPVVRTPGGVTSGIAFQNHSEWGFSYARARHEGFYYETQDGKRNYEGVGRRKPKAGTFRWRHYKEGPKGYWHDPFAEHQFLFHIARATRMDVRLAIAYSIAKSLRSRV